MSAKANYEHISEAALKLMLENDLLKQRAKDFDLNEEILTLLALVDGAAYKLKQACDSRAAKCTA